MRLLLMPPHAIIFVFGARNELVADDAFIESASFEPAPHAEDRFERGVASAAPPAYRAVGAQAPSHARLCCRQG
jgi:hypothetical protein